MHVTEENTLRTHHTIATPEGMPIVSFLPKGGGMSVLDREVQQSLLAYLSAPTDSLVAWGIRAGTQELTTEPEPQHFLTISPFYLYVGKDMGDGRVSFDQGDGCTEHRLLWITVSDHTT